MQFKDENELPYSNQEVAVLIKTGSTWSILYSLLIVIGSIKFIFLTSQILSRWLYTPTPCVCYFDEESSRISEELLEFIPIVDLTRKDISNKITSALITLGLKLEDLRGQGYDGRSAIKSYEWSVRIISSKYHKAIYTHCASHTLN